MRCCGENSPLGVVACDCFLATIAVMWLGLLGQHVVEHSRYINVNCQQTHMASFLETLPNSLHPTACRISTFTLQFLTHWLLMLYLLITYILLPLNPSAVQNLIYIKHKDTTITAKRM